MTNELLTSPAAERNKEPILTVLETVLPASGSVLEIASGSGQHVCYFATELPGIRWQPTEPDGASREAIVTRIRESGLTNIEDPLPLDVREPRWPVAASYDAVLCINMVHISPWTATEGLMAGAGRVLRPGGVLFLYGPYVEDGVETAPSNLAFDADLRRLEDVKALAQGCGLVLVRRVSMPANNLSLVFERRA